MGIPKMDSAAAVVEHDGCTHVIFALPHGDGEGFFAQKITKRKDGSWTEPHGYEDGYNRDSPEEAVAGYFTHLESVILNG